MKFRLLCLTLLLCVGSQAAAEQNPTAASKDARMRVVTYDPKQVVRLSTAIGSALVISFSADEKVTAVAVSNSNDLMANPRDNFLFMKAKAALPPQPVAVLTSGPRGLRRYIFEVESRTELASGNRSGIYYSVEFVYPADRAEAQAVADVQRTAAEESQRIREQMKNVPQEPLTGTKNWRYVARGSRTLVPTEVFDNGTSTAFRFPGSMRIPSLFRINSDGREAAVSYHLSGDYVIVDSVASGWRLRDGNTVLCLWNRAYDRIGRSPSTNTSSPRVARMTKEASR